MSVEENKALVRRHTEEYWNQKKYEIGPEIHTPDCTFHDADNPPLTSSEAYDEFAKMYHAAFPDMHFTTEDMVAEGDRVAARWTCTGRIRAR